MTIFNQMKNRIRIQLIYFFTAVMVLLFSCQPENQRAEEKQPEQDKPLNIILMIGDGMGLSQVSSAYYYGDQKPNFSRFKFIGLINTSSATEKITDSAAGATAFACGKLTYNGALGVTTDSSSVENITEYLADYNYASGLVVTSSITHATPAGFYAHVKSRNLNEKIASQLVHSNIDFFIGGGRKFFEDRSDHADMTDSLKQNGFEVFYSLDNFPVPQPDKKYGVLAAEDGMPKANEGRGNFLARGTSLALDYLSSRKSNFFLMVEGSQIDWGGHDNDADYLIAEVLDFDKAIGKALDFADKDGHTLVVVTADHETGGFTLGAKNIPGDGADYNQIAPTFSTDGHSTTLIPVFAYGPGAKEFIGIYKNTGIFDKMVKVLDLKNDE